ncbi:MAG: hypothetical protein V4721_08980 [Bacteroidota bacterium]
MAGKGGARPGAGRPTIAKELATADLARNVLIEKYGSLNEALIALLDTGEPALQKFVFEHAFGKSPDKIEHSGINGLTLHIVRGKSTT